MGLHFHTIEAPLFDLMGGLRLPDHLTFTAYRFSGKRFFGRLFMRAETRFIYLI